MNDCGVVALTIFSIICCLYTTTSCCIYCDRHYRIQENNRIYDNANQITPIRTIDIAPIINQIISEKNNDIIKTIIIQNPIIDNDDDPRYYIGFARNNLSIQKVAVN